MLPARRQALARQGKASLQANRSGFPFSFRVNTEPLAFNPICWQFRPIFNATTLSGPRAARRNNTLTPSCTACGAARHCRHKERPSAVHYARKWGGFVGRRPGAGAGRGWGKCGPSTMGHSAA